MRKEKVTRASISPCKCREKTTCPVVGTYQQFCIVYGCKVSSKKIIRDHPHYYDSQKILLKTCNTNVKVLSNTKVKEALHYYPTYYGNKRKNQALHCYPTCERKK